MGLTERHWFENEDVPENYEWALEDAVFVDVDGAKKSRYSEEIKDELVSLMIKYLENHEIFKLLELVVSAVATKEQEGR